MYYKLKKDTISYLNDKELDFSLRGFRYLGYILENYDDLFDYKITNVYKEVGRKFNSTASSVDRCLRHLFSKVDNKKNNKKMIVEMIVEYEIVKEQENIT